MSFGSYEEGNFRWIHTSIAWFSIARGLFPAKTSGRSCSPSLSPIPCMLGLMAELKEKYRLKIVITSNEGRELVMHRIPLFGLDKLADYFIFSCFIHIRKPDPNFYHMALDMNQVPPEESGVFR